MIAQAAREIRDGERIFVGMRLPLIAFVVAVLNWLCDRYFNFRFLSRLCAMLKIDTRTGEYLGRVAVAG